MTKAKPILDIEQQIRAMPLRDLVDMARDNAPAITSWPERLIPLFWGTPALTAMWRATKLPDTYVGYPVLMRGGARAGGSHHPIQTALQVRRFRGDVERAGVVVDDLSVERAEALARMYVGFVVPLQSLSAAQVTERAYPVLYRDELFEGQHYWPFAQVWRFQEPVFQATGGQGWYFAHGAEKRAVVKAMQGATRVA